MKKLILLTLLLSGCQLTIQRLPAPVEADVAGALKQHAENLNVLIEDYKARHPQKSETNK